MKWLWKKIEHRETQLLGALLCYLGIALTLFEKTTSALLTFGAVLVLDLVLYYTDNETISEWMWNLVERKWVGDYIVIIAVSALFWWLLGPQASTCVLCGYVIVHFHGKDI